MTDSDGQGREFPGKRRAGGVYTFLSSLTNRCLRRSGQHCQDGLGGHGWGRWGRLESLFHSRSENAGASFDRLQLLLQQDFSLQPCMHQLRFRDGLPHICINISERVSDLSTAVNTYLNSETHDNNYPTLIIATLHQAQVRHNCLDRASTRSCVTPARVV